MKIESSSNTTKREKSKEKDKIDELTGKNFDLNENFEVLFPNLAEEMKIDKSALPISGIRWNLEKDEDFQEINELKNPTVISYIRRCSKKEEAIEIIEYVFKRGEITEDYAKKLKEQLETEGLDSFGSKKKPGYYESKFRT